MRKIFHKYNNARPDPAMTPPQNKTKKVSMNKIFEIFSICLMVLLLSSTAAWCATFKGKVIDADTKAPIEGAVVVAR